MIYELINENNLSSAISNVKICILKFYMDGCGPCERLTNGINMSDSITNNLNVNIININQRNFPNLLNKYAIDSFPTVVMYVNGQYLQKIVGISADGLATFIRQNS